MKVLVVCSRVRSTIAPFIKEQIESLEKQGVQISCFSVKKPGMMGYLMALKPLIIKIKDFNPDLIHAHYGLSGLLANLQRKIPVVTTYHGSDINNSKVLPFSKIATKLSVKNIFVSHKLLSQVRKSEKNIVIPCGVDTSIFYPINKIVARKKMGFKPESKLILFSSAFTNTVKNYPLAKSAIEKLNDVLLIELNGYTREQVNLLFNVCDAALMTSFSEGSPQFIKEAMACNCPIVAADVGDVRQNTESIKGCYVTSFLSENVAAKINMALQFGKRTNTRKKLLELGFDNEAVSKRIIEVYRNVGTYNGKK